MKSSRTSPLTQIIKQKYTISKDVLSEISKALDEKGADTLQIGQVNDLESRLQRLLNDMVSFSADEFNVSLKTMNIDATKLLYALRPLINSRETGNTSLGINNILYVALILLLIEDDTIRTFLSGDLYHELLEQDHEGLLERSYEKSASPDGYTLNLTALQDATLYDSLYAFFSDCVPTANGTTILAVEEPESHLHPIYQRLLYRHIMNKTNTSVMITTHSTHISSVAAFQFTMIKLQENLQKPEGFVLCQLVVQGKRAFSFVQETCKISMVDGLVKSLHHSGLHCRNSKIVEMMNKFHSSYHILYHLLKGFPGSHK